MREKENLSSFVYQRSGLLSNYDLGYFSFSPVATSM